MTDIVVHSDAMNRDVPLTVIKPADETKPRGVLYLLNGAELDKRFYALAAHLRVAMRWPTP